VLDGDFTQRSGYRAVGQMLAGGDLPDAIFAGNDMMAVGALLALQEAGVRCPEDIAVVGFDDVPIAELVRPALTTMRVDIAGTGKRAMERLVTLIQARDAGPGPADTANEIVRPTLVVRGSTTPVSGGTNAPFQSNPAEAKPTAPEPIPLGEIQDV
jgi:LacI family transcriptional regulator